jgi:hypothetical protein
MLVDIRSLILALLFPSILAAIELEIRFPLLEKQLAHALFTQDGKRYVKGDPKSRCSFAYLANPHFSSKDGQLLIRATFTGRSSLDVLGRCMGFGDSFDFEVLAGLATKDGTLVLTQPKVALINRDTFYSRRVRQALEGSIGDAVKYPIRDEVRKLLAAASQGSPYKITIGKLEIRGITIEKDAVILDVDTRFQVE